MSGNRSTAIQAEHNKVFQGFDLQSIKKCTPEVFGFSVCAEASAEGGTVFLTLTASTPLGDFSKTFKVNANIDFQFNPIGPVTIDVSVRNFSINADSISFDLTIKGCIDLPIIGKKCVESTFKIDVPLPFGALDANNFSQLSSGDLALRLLAAQADRCQCGK